jgi:hypothetical protein
MKILILCLVISLANMQNFLHRSYELQAAVDDYVKCYWIKGFNLFNINTLSRKADAKE